MPEMHQVSSSNIAAVGYDAESESVYVEFLNGSTYRYSRVSKGEFENLKTADSVGSYFNRNYKNAYPFEKV